MSIMTFRNLGTCILVICFLIGCARREADEDGVGDTSPSPTLEKAPPLIPAPPPASSSSVELQLAVTPQAEQALAEAGEIIILEVIYAGDPAPGAASALNELGLVEIGKITHELQGPGTLTLDTDALDQGRMAQIEGQPHVIVNATSSRRNSNQNLLACPFYWETLSVASRDGIQVSCDLHG